MCDYGSDRLKVVVPDIWANGKAENGNFSYSLAHIYEEEVPALEWEMTGEHGTVASFDCQKAECDFRGRRWEAWFAPEIPVSEGPWKLKGLPGWRRWTAPVSPTGSTWRPMPASSSSPSAPP